ncbi:2'-5' RNA ligase family protein [Nodosilinea sp. LEGE 07088]|uniref:2'-5' RNA ligase family protein n=1 Tax=Nodosilinea sp. LEGE 07088 TaxID=2777968 RepID=UPI001880F65F|nr:2'-5' RNA ligase family protein [Nodosilinea sp. LEGE 07088]MBE9137835.1 2'-5' RNA ligase family protein [Nodosilinea sp. LEGE 07088]
MTLGDSTSAAFFVALLPPQLLQDEITLIKQDIGRRFGSKAALKSPPHITIQSPFQWPIEWVDELEHHLANFAQAQSTVPIRLAGFSAFAPRVLYINVVKTDELMAIQPALLANLEATCGLCDRVAKSRPFIPHVTVGFRDLSTAAFHRAWAEFKDRPFAADFVVQSLTLLRHNDQNWQISAHFPLRTRTSRDKT